MADHTATGQRVQYFGGGFRFHTGAFAGGHDGNGKGLGGALTHSWDSFGKIGGHLSG